MTENNWWCSECSTFIQDENTHYLDGRKLHDGCHGLSESSTKKLEKAVDNMESPKFGKTASEDIEALKIVEEKKRDLIMFAFGWAIGNPKEAPGIARDLFYDLKKLGGK